MIIAITGGRTFGDIATLQRKFPFKFREHPLWLRREAEYQFIFRTLSYAAVELSQHYRADAPWRAADLRIVAGAASGADTAAIDWAKANMVDYKEYPAEWEKYGMDVAGLIRNQEMIDTERPNLLIAFPGRRGTEDMIRRAKKAQIEIRRMTHICAVTMEGHLHAGTEF